MLRMRRLVLMVLLEMLRVCHVHQGNDGDVLRHHQHGFVHGNIAQDLAR